MFWLQTLSKGDKLKSCLFETMSHKSNYFSQTSMILCNQWFAYHLVQDLKYWNQFSQITPRFKHNKRSYKRCGHYLELYPYIFEKSSRNAIIWTISFFLEWALWLEKLQAQKFDANSWYCKVFFMLSPTSNIQKNLTIF